MYIDLHCVSERRFYCSCSELDTANNQMDLEADAAMDGQGPEGPNGQQDTSPIDILRCFLCHICIITLVWMFSTINIRPIMFKCQLWSAKDVFGRYASMNMHILFALQNKRTDVQPVCRNVCTDQCRYAKCVRVHTIYLKLI